MGFPEYFQVVSCSPVNIRKKIVGPKYLNKPLLSEGVIRVFVRVSPLGLNSKGQLDLIECRGLVYPEDFVV